MSEITKKQLADTGNTSDHQRAPGVSGSSGTAENVIALIAALPIPGVSKVLKPISKIFAFFKTSELKEVLIEVKHSNAQLENVYNVIMAALRVNDLEGTVDKSLREIVELRDALAHDDRLGGDVPHVNDAAERLTVALNDNALHANETATRYLNDFEKASGAGSGHLADLVGQYVYGISQATQSVALAQYGFNMVREQNTLLQAAGKLTDQDTKLASRVARKSEQLYEVSQAFLETVVPKCYPGWCKAVFSGEPAHLAMIDKKEYLVCWTSGTGGVLFSYAWYTPDLASSITIKMPEEERAPGASLNEVWEIWQEADQGKTYKWFQAYPKKSSDAYGPFLYNPLRPKAGYTYHERCDIRYYEKKLVLGAAGSEDVLECNTSSGDMKHKKYVVGDKKTQWYLLPLRR